MKRQLTKDEKALAIKQAHRIKEELEHLEWLMKYNLLMLDEGYHMNYLEKMRAGRKNMKDLKDEAKIAAEKIDILHDQIRNGVVVKEKKDGGEGDSGE